MHEIRSRTLNANGLTFSIDEAGDGDTLAVLLHGFPESKESWHKQLPHLASLGWHVVAPNMRGYGETTRPKELDAYRIEHLVADVAAIFASFPARRKILIAHDWGGVIAWQVALRKAVALDGLVILNAPHPAVFDRVLRKGWRQKLRSWYVLFFQLPWLPERSLTANDGAALVRALSGQSPQFDPALMQTLRSNVTQPGAATAMINYYRANIRGLSDTSAMSGQIDVPTLMVWGENDVALDIALTHGNDEFVGDFLLKLVAGASHWVQQDAPDAVNAHIAEWGRQKGLCA